jgi:head-tail adaptor
MPRRRAIFVTETDIGERRHPVAIQQGSDSVDASGFPTITWTVLHALVWMAREDVGGMERLTSLQTQAAYETRWVMPYQADMDPEVVDVTKLRRLVYRGRSHDIQRAQVIDDRANIELFTMASPQ